MIKFLRKAITFLLKDLLESTSYKFYFFFELFGIMFAVLLFFFLSKVIPEKGAIALEPYGGSYFPFALVGFALAHYLELAMHGMGKKIRDAQLLGTFEALLVTRTPASQILFFSILYPFIFTSTIVFAYLLCAWGFFGMDLSQAAWISAGIYFVLSAAALAPLGILSAAVIIIIKRGEPTAMIITALSYLLSGVFYPVSVLPGWLQVVAEFFPLTHALEGIRLALLSGVSITDSPYPMFMLILFAVLLLPLSLWVFSKALRYSRKSGGLHHY